MPVIWVRISMCRLISGSLYFVGKEQSMRTKNKKRTETTTNVNSMIYGGGREREGRML